MSIGLKGHILGVDFPPQIVFADGAWEAVWEEDTAPGAGGNPGLACHAAVAEGRSRSPSTASTSRAGSSPSLPYLVWAPDRQDARRARADPRAEERRQEGRRDRHRDRLRPRGRAHRQRRRGARSRRQQEGADQARPVLGDHQGRGRACVRRARRRRRVPGAGRRVAPGHRPGVGRRAHPLPDDGQVLRLRQREVGRPRADADARAHRRARARARGVRPRDLLDGEGRVPFERGEAKGTEFSAGHATDRFKSEAEATARHGGHRGKTSGTVTAAEKKQPQGRTADSVQHHRAAGRCGLRGHHARRARCASPSRSTWTASSATRVSTTRCTRSRSTSRHPRSAVRGAVLPRAHRARSSKRRPAAPDARRQGDHRPPADPPDRRRRPGQAQARGVEALQPRRAALPGDAVGRGGHRGHQGHHRRRPASRSSPRATSSSSPGFRAHLPLRPEEGRAAPGALRERRRRLPRRRVGAEADRAAGALLARASSSRRWRSAGWAPRRRATPSSSGCSRSSTRSTSRCEPTCLGRAVIEALSTFAPRITTPDMTSELEAEMDDIANGRSDARDGGRPLARAAGARRWTTLIAKAAEVGEMLKDAGADDAKVGVCPKSGHDLLIKSSAKTRGQFVGCSGWPECDVTYPLPQGKIEAVDGAVPGLRHAAGQGHPVPQQAARRLPRSGVRDQLRARDQRRRVQDVRRGRQAWAT